MLIRNRMARTISPAETRIISIRVFNISPPEKLVVFTAALSS
jgi:hypothetical protein